MNTRSLPPLCCRWRTHRPWPAPPASGWTVEHKTETQKVGLFFWSVSFGHSVNSDSKRHVSSHSQWWACSGSPSCLPALPGNKRRWRWYPSPRACWLGRWARRWWPERRTWSASSGIPRRPPRRLHTAPREARETRQSSHYDNRRFSWVKLASICLTAFMHTGKDNLSSQ